MVSLLFGQLAESEAPADENAVRSTTTPVDGEKGPAEAKGAPDWNEFESDPDPSIGMTERQVASAWHEGDQYAPFWSDETDNMSASAFAIDHQVGTSGTAAAREKAGQFGHGTMKYAVGIEPTIRDGAAFGQDYFTATPRSGVNPTMTPGTGVQPAPGLDRDDISAVAAYGRTAARDAAEASAVSAWYAQLMS